MLFFNFMPSASEILDNHVINTDGTKYDMSVREDNLKKCQIKVCMHRRQSTRYTIYSTQFLRFLHSLIPLQYLRQRFFVHQDY